MKNISFSLVIAITIFVFFLSGCKAIPDAVITGQVLYSATSSDLLSQIFIVDLDSHETKQLTYIGSNESPVWSPDGKQIAFSSDRNGTVNIYIMNADGQNQQPLTQCLGNASSPAWSPDGSRIAFVSDCQKNGNVAIYGIDIKTNIITRLTHDSANYLFPSWSSNGDRIAYTLEDEKFIAHIYIMNTNGTNVTWITNGASKPIWCPDDTCLLYQLGWGQGYIPKLQVMDLLTGETRPFLSGSNATLFDIFEWLPTRSPVRGLISFNIGEKFYSMDLKNMRLYPSGLQIYGGSLYP